MDEILENSYFNTNIKDKYSFPKSDRFPDLKPNRYTIDYYDSSSMSKSRTTSFGYGAKYDFLKEAKKGPSPFQYQVKDEKMLTRGLSFGYGRDQIKMNSYIDPEKLKILPSSNYIVDPLKLKRREPSCYIMGRRPVDSFIQPDHNPDPSKYNPVDTFYSRRKRSVEFGFGSARRFDYGQKSANKMVGPGSYQQSPKNLSKYGTIGHANRKTYAVQQIEKSISPGPKYILK